MSNIPSITINVTAHGEGILLYKTLRSIWNGYDYAKRKGVDAIEFNISLDRADAETTAIAEQFAKDHPEVDVKLHKIDVGDLGESRNFLIGKSAGKYIVFFDGDDFFSENYLYEAYQLAEQYSKPAVYSPALMINFEAQNYIIPKLESTSPEFKRINLFEVNYFISQNFVSREIYERITYLANRNGFGMEDWHWNVRVLSAGFEFRNVPDTIFFYRRKKQGSMIAQQVQNKALLRPADFFEPAYFGKYEGYQVSQKEINIAARPSTKQRLKKGSVKTLRKFMSGDSVLYRYLREQYLVNRAYGGAFKAAVKQRKVWMKPVENADFYADPTKPDRSIPEHLQAVGVNEKVIEQWAKLNMIEPMIRPSRGVLDSIGVDVYLQTSIMSSTYHELCKYFGDKGFTDVVFVPHLVRGGADLAALNLIRALAENLKKRVLVFTTEGTESPWADKARNIPGVEIIEFRVAFPGLSHDQRKQLLAQLIQNWDIERVSVVNSAFGYEIIQDYGKQLGERTKLFLYTYAFDMTPDGYIFNYLTNGLVDAYPNVDDYFTDSAGYRDQLVLINGFDKKKVHEIYLPVMSDVRPRDNNKVTKKVLWASRISKDKLLEVAVEVADRVAKENIEIHFYGSMDALYELGDKFNKLISGRKNIVYHGTYDGFANLPIDEYDMFLLTSKNEGMPNVVLESVMANLFVVAPRVGGIPEVVVDGKNGFLVDDNFKASAYAEKVLAYYHEPKLQDLVRREKFNREIMSHHEWGSFVTRVSKFYG